MELLGKVKVYTHEGEEIVGEVIGSLRQDAGDFLVFSSNEITKGMQVVAHILHIGKIDHVELPDGSTVAPTSSSADSFESTKDDSTVEVTPPVEVPAAQEEAPVKVARKSKAVDVAASSNLPVDSGAAPEDNTTSSDEGVSSTEETK